MTYEERKLEVQRHLDALSEYFDSVQVLASIFNADGTTQSIYDGRGNWYSRHGMAREFILRGQEEMLVPKADDDFDGVNS